MEYCSFKGPIDIKFDTALGYRCISIRDFFFFFGRFEALGNIAQMIPQENMLHLQGIWIDAIHNNNLRADSRQSILNANVPPHNINAGDYVYIRNNNRKKSDIRNTIWIGPFFVLRIEGDVIYILKEDRELRRHISEVKLFDNSLAEEDSEDIAERRSPDEIVQILEVDLGRNTATTTKVTVKYAQIAEPVTVPLLEADFLDKPIFKDFCNTNPALTRLVNSIRK